jgi:hypothetical protein
LTGEGEIIGEEKALPPHPPCESALIRRETSPAQASPTPAWTPSPASSATTASPCPTAPASSTPRAAPTTAIARSSPT